MYYASRKNYVKFLHSFQLLRLQCAYHECERQRSRTTRPMQCWIIISSDQGYGHVAQDPRNAGP